MSIDIGCVVVSETVPSGSISSDPSMDDWVWLKPSTGVWHNYDVTTGQWVPVGVAGITGEFEGTFKKIKIENGIITEFEVE